MTPPSNAGGEGREVLAREVLAEHAERYGYPLAAGSIRRGDDPWFYTVCARAMLAFSDREHATPRSMPEEVVEAYERAGNLLPMADAPRGEYILARYRRNDDERTAHWSGRWFVIRHEGRTPSDYDLGWALFPGYGGVPDISFDGWLPLPQAAVTPGASA